jgi:hypothetical protein
MSLLAVNEAAERLTIPVLFDTSEADSILSAMQILPLDNPWNEDISNRPVHPNSPAIIRSIGADKPLGYNLDMHFVLVPPDQPTVPVRVTMYPAESDPGPFPIPPNAPIKNWPLARNEDRRALPGPGMTLERFQREGTGDRHLIVVDPLNHRVHGFWQARRTDAGRTRHRRPRSILRRTRYDPNDGHRRTPRSSRPSFATMKSRAAASHMPCV